MTHLRQRTAACLIAGWLVAGSSPGVLAHPTSANEFNSTGSCAALGHAVAEGVWQWCAKNEEKTFERCRDSFRSWVRDVERKCIERRHERGCSPSDYDAALWHMHGWKRPGQQIKLDFAVRYCEEGTQGQAAGSGAGGTPAELDREARRRVQTALTAQGYDPGQPDGEFGPRTRAAIQAWQQANGHAATGELTAEQVERLLAAESPPGSAATGDLHGSIAFAKLDRGSYAYGIAWNAESPEAARRGAREECARHGGGSACREVGGFRNACGALAIGDNNGFGTGWGATNAEAESDALSNCRAANRNCRGEVSRCVDGEYIRSEPVAMKPSGPNWIVAENQPCQLYNAYPEPGETVTWSGDCVNGKASGEGRAVWRDSHGEGVYESGYRDGKVYGRGTFTRSNGNRYEGEFRDGTWGGRGTFTWASGDRYEGEWRDGKENGNGTLTLADGSRYEGQWQEGKPHGEGTYTSDGYTYKGRWNKGCFGERGDGNWAAVSTTAEACGFINCKDLVARRRAFNREWDSLLRIATDKLAKRHGIPPSDVSRVMLYSQYDILVFGASPERFAELIARGGELESDERNCKE